MHWRLICRQIDHARPSCLAWPQHPCCLVPIQPSMNVSEPQSLQPTDPWLRGHWIFSHVFEEAAHTITVITKRLSEYQILFG